MPIPSIQICSDLIMKIPTIKFLLLAFFSYLFFSSMMVRADHSEFEWHLLDSEVTMDLCKRVLHEGKVIHMSGENNWGKDNPWKETILYFAGSLYEVKYHLGLKSIACRSYRISPTTRTLPKPG